VTQMDRNGLKWTGVRHVLVTVARTDRRLPHAGGVVTLVMVR
jgi:hypothetical protein